MLYVIIGIMAFSLLFTGGAVGLVEYDTQSVDSELWIVVAGDAVILLVITLSMWFTRMKVWIDDDGVRIRMVPFHLRKGRVIRWSDVQSITLRKVSPFGEFGGWGIRWNLGKTMGYVWNGKQGIELLFTNGKRVVITLTDMEGARAAIANRNIEVHDRLV